MRAINWNSDTMEESRVSISDGTETSYVSEDQLPEEFTLREIAEMYALTYDHNGENDTYAICMIEDLDDEEEHIFAFDGHGNFEWNSDRQYLSH